MQRCLLNHVLCHGAWSVLVAIGPIWAAMDLSSARAAEPTAERSYDVVVYGGTSAGVAAAVQVTRMGKSVVIVEPSKHLGGLSSGGLGATDIGNKAAIGGVSREFYQRVYRHYADREAWDYETPEEYRERKRGRGIDEDTMWGFEPHVAEAIFKQMVREAKIPVVFGDRLDLETGVKKNGTRIQSIKTEGGRIFHAKTFIDATYEGDLMAKAGVSYTVGREPSSKYGEIYNGVAKRWAVHHQFIVPVDPYVEPGNPASGLLPGIHGDSPGENGDGDHRVQAYCYRMCTTDAPENRREWPKPKNYDPARYELLLRNFEAGDHRVPWNPVWMPNRKTDTNNNFAISTDNIGMNYEYPDGDYETRERILKEHEIYQKGLMWTLANSPRVPDEVRKEFQRLGLAKDEFVDNDNWPHQIYVREARRMVSEYVMTENDCLGRREARDSVGLGAYNMDSHNVQRYVDEDGHARNEGDVQKGVNPYPISYRSIVPKADECSNLVVPVCLSASHIAFGSIRMEPVFMLLGQSAATAAVHAINESCAVQEIDYPTLRDRLLADNQVLEWTGPRRKLPLLINSKTLPGVVVDDTDAEKTGHWEPSASIGPFIDAGYLHDNNENKGEMQVRYEAKLPADGRYEVRLAYSPNPNRATDVPVTISHAEGETRLIVNQRKTLPEGQTFASVGTFDFKADRPAVIVISNEATHGHVIADAVQWLPVK